MDKDKLFESYPCNAKCPLKGHRYLKIPAVSFQLKVYLSMYDFLVDKRVKAFKENTYTYENTENYT